MRGTIPRFRGVFPPGLLVAVLAVASWGALAAPASAQYEAAPPPAAWVLQNVTIVHADATVEEGMTIVVRDGLIETLAAGADVPADARSIDWEDGVLHVYPGVVDAYGSVEVELPTPDREGVQSWTPTREVQYFTPHRVTADFLSVAGEDLSGHRAEGIIASVAYPGRGIMPGQPSLLLHRIDADVSRDLVLAPSVGVTMAFQGAPGAYPGTLMAQHAFIRQVFLDAEHYGVRSEAAAADPRGVGIAGWDADYEMVQRMARGEVPVLFRVDDAEDIRRVLSLSDELGFSPVIVGGAEAGVLAAELAERGVPVLLDAVLPDPDDWDPDAEEDEELTPDAFRERRSLEPIYRTPAMLAEAGVPFALTSGGEGAVDLFDGIRRALDYGLDPDRALHAMTAWPAEWLERPELVRIEEGMPANFIVTDRPVFDEGMGVAWVFVNGQVEKGSDPRTEGEVQEGGGEPIDMEAVVGSWEGFINAEGQQVPAALELTEDNGELSGTMSSMGGPPAALDRVTLDGNTLTWSFSIPDMGGAPASFSGSIDGDLMTGTGTIDTPGGSFSFNFELRRQPAGDDR